MVNRVGGWMGGTRANTSGSNTRSYGMPPDTRERIQAINQTTFGYSPWYYEKFPKYPSPQSIRSMPKQLAGYDDDYNVQGQIASTANMGGLSSGGQTFLDKINKVYINPAFAEPLMASPNDPDSPKYKSNYKPIGRYQREKLAKISQGVSQFANATSKYFNKDVEIIRPNQYPPNAGNYQNTAKINIEGYREDTMNPRSAGFVGLWDSYHRPRTEKTGKETRKVTGPHVFNQYINTSIDERRYNQGPSEYGGTMLHEFGHNLGVMHPKGHKSGGAKNSKMSYDNTAYDLGPTLGPADINMYKEAYAIIDAEKMRKSAAYRKRAESAYKGIAKKRK